MYRGGGGSAPIEGRRLTLSHTQAKDRTTKGGTIHGVHFFSADPKRQGEASVMKLQPILALAWQFRSTLRQWLS